MQDIKGSFGAQVSCLNEASRAISDALEHISPGFQLLVPGVFCLCFVSVYQLPYASQTALDAPA